MNVTMFFLFICFSAVYIRSSVSCDDDDQQSNIVIPYGL